MNKPPTSHPNLEPSWFLFLNRDFQRIGPSADSFIELRCVSTSGMSPFYVTFFKASHWSSAHLIRSQPLFSQPHPPFFGDKSRNLSKIVSVLLSALVERFFVSCMWDFFLKWLLLLAVGTSTALQVEVFNSTSMTLQRYFNGTSMAIQRNCNEEEEKKYMLCWFYPHSLLLFFSCFCLDFFFFPNFFPSLDWSSGQFSL